MVGLQGDFGYWNRSRARGHREPGDSSTHGDRERRQERQARMVGALLLESHEHFGVTLPPDIEDALAKDSQEISEKTSGAKLPQH